MTDRPGDSEDTAIEVWLVEDNATYRRGLSRALSAGKGIRCGRQFECAEALFTALRSGTLPDVVLLDVQLPGLDGLTALGEIRRDHPELRTIVLTAFDDDGKIFRAVCAGASGYLLKSADRTAIANAVHEVMEGGAPMTPSVARKVLDLFAPKGPFPVEKTQYPITEREREILRLMADGLIKKEIADLLAISVHTVNTHIRSIYDKLHVNTNTGAVAKALREDLI